MASLDEVKGLMRTPTKFKYSDSLDMALCSSTKVETGRAEIENAFLVNMVGLSDMYIVWALIELRYANVEMIAEYLRQYKRVYPDKLVPNADDSSAIKSRVHVLESIGVIRGIKYTTELGDEIRIYWASEVGATVAKLQLDKPDKMYKNLLGARHPVEIMRCIATAYVGLMMARNRYCAEFIGFDDVKMGNIYGKNKLYSKLYYKAPGKKYLAVVEPVYFSTSSNITTDYENIAYIKSRLNIVANYLSFNKSLLAEGKDAPTKIKVVIVVEDYEGFRKAFDIIRELSTDLLSHCVFTSENVLYSRGNELKDSFIKVVPKPDGSGWGVGIDKDEDFYNPV